MKLSLQVEVDKAAGFCFGVEKAVELAEKQLSTHGSIYCLGSLVHNKREVQRLENAGLKIISHDDMQKLHNTRVLIRAHGEPPETYSLALKNNIELIDATCKVVLKLQSRIKNDFLSGHEQNAQLVIYGKKNHPEVEGLMGQTNGKAILISDNEPDSINRIDFSRNINLYCQTTQSIEGYVRLVDEIKSRIKCNKHADTQLSAHDTICRQVSGRGPKLEAFAGLKDVIIFVSGQESSNGRFLFERCKQFNIRSYMISGPDDINKKWFNAGDRVGVSGATSTPQWQMQEVASLLAEF